MHLKTSTSKLGEQLLGTIPPLAVYRLAKRPIHQLIFLYF